MYEPVFSWPESRKNALDKRRICEVSINKIVSFFAGKRSEIYIWQKCTKNKEKEEKNKQKTIRFDK